jgi:threonylcarbamoyladenosine tRNA methylthiotransferase MtaB
MPGVAMAERRARAALLRQAGQAEAERFLAGYVGRDISVLTEADQTGHSEHFAPVRLAAHTSPGTLLTARVTGTTGRALLAEAA